MSEFWNLGTLWVCQCCMLVHANGECCPDDSHGGDGIEPWATLGDGVEVAMGLDVEEHAEDCQIRITGERPVDYECDCERSEFSQSQCEGCGSYLHGERFAFAARRVTVEISEDAGDSERGCDCADGCLC